MLKTQTITIKSITNNKKSLLEKHTAYETSAITKLFAALS